MLRVAHILQAGGWHDIPADTLTVDYDTRHRRRIVLTGDAGLEFLLDLPQAVPLAHGQALVLEDGRLVEVIARPEALLDVRAGHHISLPRLAWHLGNRHLDAQIEDDRILIRQDHVIADMLRHLGAQVMEIVAPFHPEGGAYGGHSHSHS